MITTPPAQLGTAPTHGHAPRTAARGFTLLEVVVGMTLLSLLTGMVFGIVSTSVKCANIMRDQQQESGQVNRFIALCRNTFQSLPSTAILTLTVTQVGDPAQQELTISGAPEAFPFGTTPICYKDTTLGLRPDQEAMDAAAASDDPQEAGAGPRYFIGLSRQDLIPTDPNQNSMLSRSNGQGVAAADDQGRFWMPLMANATSLYWRFYRVDDDSWQEEWSSTTLPQLIEMNLQLQGHTQPIRVVFALPLATIAGPNAALAAPAAATAGGAAGAAGKGKGKGKGEKGERGKGERGKGERGKGERGKAGKGERGAERGGESKGGPGSRGGANPGAGNAAPSTNAGAGQFFR